MFVGIVVVVVVVPKEPRHHLFLGFSFRSFTQCFGIIIIQSGLVADGAKTEVSFSISFLKREDVLETTAVFSDEHQ